MISDQQEANATALSEAETAVTEAKADIAAVDGLTQAVSNLQAAEAAEETAAKEVTSAQANLAAAVASYETFNSPITVAANGTVSGLIKLNTKGELVLESGVTEETNQGITSVLNTSIAKEQADDALTEAQQATAAAQEAVNSLDLSATAESDLSDVAVEMGLSATATPSAAEIESEIDTRVAELKTAATASGFDLTQSSVDLDDGVTPTESQALLTAAQTEETNASDTVKSYAFAPTPAGANLTPTEVTTAETALDDGIAALNTAIGGITYATSDTVTIGKIEALTATAVSDGFISSADKTVIDGAFADVDPDTESDTATDFNTGTTLAEAITAAQTAVSNNNNVDEFDADVAAYVAAQDTAVAAEDLDTLVDLYDTFQGAASNDNPLVGALETAETAVETAQDDIDALSEAVTDLQEAQADVAQLETLNESIDTAEQWFTDNDYLVPETLAAGTNLATAGSDIFLVGEADSSTISNFGLLGEDSLFIGNDFTLNTGDIATDGDNSVLEVFLTQVNSNTVVTLETEVFGSNSTDSEQTITLTGVAVEDVSFDEGMITVA